MACRANLSNEWRNRCERGGSFQVSPPVVASRRNLNLDSAFLRKTTLVHPHRNRRSVALELGKLVPGNLPCLIEAMVPIENTGPPSGGTHCVWALLVRVWKRTTNLDLVVELANSIGAPFLGIHLMCRFLMAGVGTWAGLWFSHRGLNGLRVCRTRHRTSHPKGYAGFALLFWPLVVVEVPNHLVSSTVTVMVLSTMINRAVPNHMF